MMSALKQQFDANINQYFSKTVMAYDPLTDEVAMGSIKSLNLLCHILHC